MANYRVAKRYALGLWEYCVSMKQEDIIMEEVSGLRDIILQNRDFVRFLESPILDYRRKISICKYIFNSSSIGFKNFLELVFRRNREEDILEMTRQFKKIYQNNKGIQRVHITSALPLEDQEMKKIALLFKEVNLEKAILINELDKDILGGYILRLGDKQLDMSIKTRLNRIKTNFLENIKL